MRHIISAAVQMSISKGDGNIADYVPRLLYNDVPRVHPILNHRDGRPFLPTDCRTSPDTWESDHHLEERPCVAVSFVFAGSRINRAPVELAAVHTTPVPRQPATGARDGAPCVRPPLPSEGAASPAYDLVRRHVCPAIAAATADRKP